MPRPAASSPRTAPLGTSASPAVARNATYTPAPSLVTDGGGIQERIRMAPGTEIARTVAVRRSHVPSHYAMLGVPRDFSPELLKKQYRLLALRYHPDAAERNGVDADEVAERFIALQTAYEVAARAISAQFGAQFSDATTASQVLSDPERRRRYDLEARLQSRREWRRAAWGGAPQLHHANHLQLVDKSLGAPPAATAAWAAAPAPAEEEPADEAAAAAAAVAAEADARRATQAEEKARGSKVSSTRCSGSCGRSDWRRKCKNSRGGGGGAEATESGGARGQGGGGEATARGGGQGGRRRKGEVRGGGGGARRGGGGGAGGGGGGGGRNRGTRPQTGRGPRAAPGRRVRAARGGARDGGGGGGAAARGGGGGEGLHSRNSTSCNDG